MGQKKVKQLSAPGSKNSSIPLKNLEGVRGEEEAGGIEGQPKSKGGGEGQREKIPNGQRGIKGLKMRVGRECSINRGGPHFTVEVYRLEEFEEEVTVLQVEMQQGAAPRVRAAKSSAFGEGKL